MCNNTKLLKKFLREILKADRLVASGIPSLEDNSVIVTLYYPEIFDIIKTQLDLLKDPSKWDYLLYLETTSSGQLINQLVPGNGETLLNFKIDLLKIALGRKAILLCMPEEDLMPTAEIIHSVSLRTNLQVLRLKVPEKGCEVAMKLFGINPLFGKSDAESLLAQLSTIGTLFIDNIEFLSLDTQEYLAEFISYGFFHIFKSNQKITSNARIVCSSTKDLELLAQEGTFSTRLLHELKKTTLKMPSLLTLLPDELNELADGFTEQAIKSTEFKNLLELTDKDRAHLIDHRAISLQEFKEHVKQLLIKKSTKQNIYNEIEFEPAYAVSDPTLFQAVQLGKHALKDVQVMTFLWNKFKSQTRIATLLGVNKSSVNRRCKEYKLISEDDEDELPLDAD